MVAPLLIVDIEGAELDALRGMTRVLESCSGLIMEVNPTAISDLGNPNELQTLLTVYFDEAWNVADPTDRYDPATVVVDVRTRHGDFVSVDIQFGRR